MAGHILLAACHLGGGVRLVGGPVQSLWVVPLGLLAPQ